MDRGPAGDPGEAVFCLLSAVFSNHQRISHKSGYIYMISAYSGVM